MKMSVSQRGGDVWSPIATKNSFGEWLAALLLAAGSCWFVMIYHAWWRSKPYSVVTFNESLAHTAFYCLALAYACGPLYRFGWLTTRPVMWRRPLGMIGVGVAILHVLVSLVPLWGKFGWDYLVVQHWDATLLGAASLALALWMLQTSLGDSVQRLGRARWFQIQLTGLALLPLVLLHFLVLGKIGKWVDWFQGRDTNHMPAGTFIIFCVGIVILALRVADALCHVRIRKAVAGVAVLVACGLWNARAVAAEEPAMRLPEVVVQEPALLEEARVGPSRQPSWTVDGRVGPTTAAYVMPPWSAELAHWWRPTTPRHGGTEHLFEEELEFGWPHRFQTDFYLSHGFDSEGTWRYQATQVEARWALADWGVLPLNPTVYAEWKFANATADAVELKLLLAETIAPHWHWGLNAIYEQQVGDERTTEYALSQALAYTLRDNRLWLGVEMKFASESAEGERSRPTLEFGIGPSVQWRPTPRTQLSIVPLFGVTGDAPLVQAFVTFRIAWGAGKKGEAFAPSSLKTE